MHNQHISFYGVNDDKLISYYRNTEFGVIRKFDSRYRCVDTVARPPREYYKCLTKRPADVSNEKEKNCFRNKTTGGGKKPTSPL